MKEMFQFALRSLKRRKAGGPDGLNSDFYKDFEDKLIQDLCTASNAILQGDEPPRSFLEAVIIPLRKKEIQIMRWTIGRYHCSKPVTRYSQKYSQLGYNGFWED